ASSGTTEPRGWDTPGPIRRRRGAACGTGSARPTRTSTSPITPGSSSGVTSSADPGGGRPSSSLRDYAFAVISAAASVPRAAVGGAVQSRRWLEKGANTVDIAPPERGTFTYLSIR